MLTVTTTITEKRCLRLLNMTMKILMSMINQHQKMIIAATIKPLPFLLRKQILFPFLLISRIHF